MSKSIGEYIVTEKIGSGSFAQVYKAHHKSTKVPVAVKAISRERLNKKLQENLVQAALNAKLKEMQSRTQRGS